MSQDQKSNKDKHPVSDINPKKQKLSDALKQNMARRKQADNEDFKKRKK